MKHRENKTYRTRKFWLDLAERAAWTAAQSAVGVAVVVIADLDWVYAPAIATALSALKGELARRVGDPDSAGTVR